ncbi:MAG: hypothetical protein IIY45_13800 [Firmicutes bacterium]|nr:hypothetical protein [Bacillota bacterium]
MNKERPVIVMVGGGSVNWSPKLINDFLQTPSMQSADYVILDIDRHAGQRMTDFGNQYAARLGIGATFRFTDKQEEAFQGADFVLITISTGDLDAMAYDISIPEEYAIYQTVGDTVGPGGWARGLRNIPVFKEMAANIEKYAPEAIVLNYTNPMAVLTNVFYKTTKLRTVGLCHGLYESLFVLQTIFGLKSDKEIKMRFGGTNHFFWLFDFMIDGRDGYKMLREKMNGQPFSSLITEFKDIASYSSHANVCSELFDIYGYLPYVADRHISEFFSSYLTGSEDKPAAYNLVRTSIADRRKMKKDAYERVTRYLNGEEEYMHPVSREAAAGIINAFLTGEDFIDVVNLPNEGQVNNLPQGSIVETLGVVRDSGFVPMVMGAMPKPLLNVVMPHISNQDMIVEAGLTGDLELAMKALLNDPMCAHLTPPQIREMGMKLLKAHRAFLPQFEKWL